MTLLKEDVEELMEKLNRLSKDALDYRGEITTNSKGEASFKVRVFSNVTSEIEVAAGEILDGLKKICTDKRIKIAGT